jgi:hypothetical protein
VENLVAFSGRRKEDRKGGVLLNSEILLMSFARKKADLVGAHAVKDLKFNLGVYEASFFSQFVVTLS